MREHHHPSYVFAHVMAEDLKDVVRWLVSERSAEAEAQALAMHEHELAVARIRSHHVLVGAPRKQDWSPRER